MAQIVYSRLDYKELKLSKREQLLVLEIGRDNIDTASRFVNYIEEVYGFSKSSVWYNLNRLKELEILEFACKDTLGKPLCLTKTGLSIFMSLEKNRNQLTTLFMNSFLSKRQYNGFEKDYTNDVYNTRGVALVD